MAKTREPNLPLSDHPVDKAVHESMQVATRETNERAANGGLLNSPRNSSSLDEALAKSQKENDALLASNGSDSTTTIPRKRRQLSSELVAMSKIDAIMVELDDDEVCLVTAWFIGKFAPAGFSCELRRDTLPTTQTGGPDL